MLLTQIKTQFRDTNYSNVTSVLNCHPSWPLSSCRIPSVHSAVYLLVTYLSLYSVRPPWTLTLRQAPCDMLGIEG